jgi:hypothetical protein
LNAYVNISNELKSFFSNHRIFKVLLPLDVVLVIGCVILLILGNFIFNLGIFTTFIYWGFILGLLLAYANFHQQFLYIGLLAYGAMNLLSFIIYLFNAIFKGYRISSLSSLVTGIIFAGLGYLVLKQSNIDNNSK